MTLRILIAALLISSPPLLSKEEPVDPTKWNAEITAATDQGEAWAKDPSTIAATLVGPWIVPDAEMASMRREVVSQTSGENPTMGVSVLVKEDGLLDDATRRIDHRFSFTLENGVWKILEASRKLHDARPAFPIREAEDVTKATAGSFLLRQAPSESLAAIGESAGITNIRETTQLAMEGDPESLNALLNLSLDIPNEAKEDYARLLFGLTCFFETPGLTRYFFFHLEEGASQVILTLLDEIKRGEI